MANYLKLFADETAYNEFKGSPAYVTPNVSYCSGGSNSLFYNPRHDYSKDYFTTVARSGGKIIFNGSTTANTLSYSINGVDWSEAAQKPSVTVGAGDKVLWKGECTPNTSNGIGKFTNDGTATFNVEGNVMSLLYGDNFKGQTSLEGKNYVFANLLSGNTKVISAKNLSLPATTLGNGCYLQMFSGCTSLTTAPALPAMTLTQSCYNSMFSNCTSLASAPELPAMTLTQSCYNNMFSNCTSLTSAPELPAKTLAIQCYFLMFGGCTSLTTAPSVLPATTLAISCYQSMFYNCSSLTTAPELPATTLVSSCYYRMFSGCTSLNSITCLATNNITASNCTGDWVSGVASSGTFKKNANMSSWTTGVSGIPDGWTVVDK